VTPAATGCTQVGGHYATSSITVLEQKDGPGFIFGLDMLKRHQCCIDLASGSLRFGSCDAVLPFLPSHMIPKDFNRHVTEVRTPTQGVGGQQTLICAWHAGCMSVGKH